MTFIIKTIIQVLLLAMSTIPTATAARQCIEGGFVPPERWVQSYPAHRVIGPLYAVGGADLSVFLITTDAGHILINTGLKDSTAMIQDNIESLGFVLSDIKLLLTMQAHFDHTAALAEIKQITGAQMWATAADARVLADGGASDAHFGDCIELRFDPVQVEKVLADGEVIELGGISLRTHLHPGHTEGSSSYSMTVHENGRDYRVVIANMGTINPGKKLVKEPTYPGVAQDFARTYQAQEAMKVDVWVAAHASQYDRDSKHEPNQQYDPQTFVDPEGFLAAVERLEVIYREQVAAEE